jgi:transposase
MKVSVIGLDLAKEVFQVHGVDERARVVVRRQLKPREVLSFFANLEPCLVGLEAGGGCHYWAREIGKLGHTVKAMAPQFVRPYVKSQKNDRRDAEAICEAVARPTMRFVSVKTVESQSILQLHHARQLLTKMRVGLSNHMRAILIEYGIALPKGVKALPERLPAILENAENSLTDTARALLAALDAQHRSLCVQTTQIEAQIHAWHRGNEASRRLSAIPGVGVLTATALVGSVGDANVFQNGRQLAAFFGLVPRQRSSGGKEKLLGISKRGDGYVRTLLVHGARAVIRWVRIRQRAGQPVDPWLAALLTRAHPNKVAVAQAAKVARIAWALLARERAYTAPAPAGAV